MRALIALLALLLIAAPVEAGKRKKPNPPSPPPEPNVVVVYDTSSDGWSPYVADTVADFNAVMPRPGPTLRYQRGVPGACMPRTDRRIPVCSGEMGRTGQTQWLTGDLWGRIKMSDSLTSVDPGYREMLVCHEMMHALTHIGDNYASRPDSCVFGYLADPGDFDVKRLRTRFT